MSLQSFDSDYLKDEARRERRRKEKKRGERKEKKREKKKRLHGKLQRPKAPELGELERGHTG